MHGARAGRGVLSLLFVVLVVAPSGCECGDEVDYIVEPNGGSGGQAGSAGHSGGAAGQGGATTSTTSTGGAGGEQCQATQCFSTHQEACRRICEQGECIEGMSPKGTACADCGGDRCDGKGHCVKPVTCETSSCPWSRSFGNWAGQYALGLAVDAAGAIIISGPFEGILDFDGTELTSTPPETNERWDGFVAKLAPTGAHLWSMSFGDARRDSAEAVAVDPDGNVVVTGFFSGTVTLGGPSLTSIGMHDVVVAKLDGSGNHLWSRSFGGTGRAYGRDVAVDPSGNVYVVGHFDGSLDLGGTLVSAGRDDAFVAKLDSDGAVLWSRSFGGVDHDTGWRVTIDPQGNALVTGTFEGTATFGASTLSSAGGHDVFLLKLDAAGNVLWSFGFGGSEEEEARDVVSDPSGRAVVTGTTRGNIDFGLGPACEHGGTNAYLVGVDADGTLDWSYCLAAGSDEAGAGLALTASGALEWTGAMANVADFGAIVSCPGNVAAVFLASATTAGEVLSGKCYDGELEQYSTNVAVDPWGNVIVIGYFWGDLSFGTGSLEACAYDEPEEPPYNGADLFVAKVTP
jgi:hypothetical protein